MTLYCETCKKIYESRDMHTDTICDFCFYSKEVESEKPTSTGRGDRAVPGKGDGGSGTITLAGQLSLPV
jgi:hypothetical protein